MLRSVSRTVLSSARPIAYSSRTRLTTVLFCWSSSMDSFHIGEPYPAAKFGLFQRPDRCRPILHCRRLFVGQTAQYFSENGGWTRPERSLLVQCPRAG